MEFVDYWDATSRKLIAGLFCLEDDIPSGYDRRSLCTRVPSGRRISPLCHDLQGRVLMSGLQIYVGSILVIVVCMTSRAGANVIDFETTPSGATPVDDAPLVTPYNIAGGGTVDFFFDTNGNNVFDSGVDARGLFEAYGQDGTDGFANSTTGIADTANGGLAGQLGNFFLRQPVAGSIPGPFIVAYATSQTITALSGEIWDIDGSQGGTEQWRVDVLDASNNVLNSQLSPLGNSLALDGLPWTFSFSGLPAGVNKVRLTFVGTKTSGLGLAFNNFSPTSAVPEPGGASLFGLGAVVTLVTLAHRRRHRPCNANAGHAT